MRPKLPDYLAPSLPISFNFCSRLRLEKPLASVLPRAGALNFQPASRWAA